MGKHELEKKHKINNKSKNNKNNEIKSKANKRAKPNKNNRIKRKILLIVQVIFIIVLIVTGIEIIKWFMDNNSNSKILANIATAISVIDNDNENKKKYEIDFEKMKKINEQTVAWLKVNNTKVEYPVVKAMDNSFYLTHNFEKNLNKAGWVFADYRNKFDGTDKNIIIYGHNMKDDSMLGSLKEVLNEKWYNNEENKYITFITENENVVYEVFSVYQIEKEDYYITTGFSENEFSKFLSTIKSRSVKDFNVDVSDQDNILTLSTCANNNKYRVVLHAKKKIS